MNLQVGTRPGKTKSENKKLRRQGDIPAVVYHRGKESEKIFVKSTDFNTFLRGVQPGRLPTRKFTLSDQNGQSFEAVIKEIQYHVTTYDILHLDFERLDEKTPVKVKVPIECTGTVDCVGVKLGGVVRNVIRHLPVECLPKDIPDALQLNVKDLNLGESLRLRDLEIPQTLRPLTRNMDEVVVVIVKR